MRSFWQDLHRVTHRLDMTRVIVVPHIAYYVMVATHMPYQYAAGVVAVVMVGELFYGHHSGVASNEASRHS